MADTTASPLSSGTRTLRPVELREAEAPEPSAETRSADRQRRRLRLYVLLGGALAAAGLAWTAHWLLVGRNLVSTDNAYVGADTAVVTPRVPGAVTGVLVSDTQPVKAGQVLVRLDDSDAQLAVAQAQAALGQAERKVRGYFANQEALGGQVAARGADIARADALVASAQADVQRAKVELGRRQGMAASGAVSGDELTEAQNRFATAAAALDAARAARVQAAAQKTAAEGSRSANDVLISGLSVGDNPEVQAARVRLAQARLDLSRTVIQAPFDGVIARRAVQVGQQVQVGAPLMSVVPVRAAYVDANFKEGQLRKVQVGQPVQLTSDLYGSGVTFHGRVAGLAGGTGSAFSLLPAQNASGNWIKIVQRLPVRIRIDPDELARHPLRVGLSMTARIDLTGGRR